MRYQTQHFSSVRHKKTNRKVSVLLIALAILAVLGVSQIANASAATSKQPSTSTLANSDALKTFRDQEKALSDICKQAGASGLSNNQKLVLKKSYDAEYKKLQDLATPAKQTVRGYCQNLRGLNPQADYTLAAHVESLEYLVVEGSGLLPNAKVDLAVEFGASGSTKTALYPRRSSYASQWEDVNALGSVDAEMKQTDSLTADKNGKFETEFLIPTGLGVVPVSITAKSGGTVAQQTVKVESQSPELFQAIIDSLYENYGISSSYEQLTPGQIALCRDFLWNEYGVDVTRIRPLYGETYYIFADS